MYVPILASAGKSGPALPPVPPVVPPPPPAAVPPPPPMPPTCCDVPPQPARSEEIKKARMVRVGFIRHFVAHFRIVDQQKSSLFSLCCNFCKIHCRYHMGTLKQMHERLLRFQIVRTIVITAVAIVTAREQLVG